MSRGLFTPNQIAALDAPGVTEAAAPQTFKDAVGAEVAGARDGSRVEREAVQGGAGGADQPSAYLARSGATTRRRRSWRGRGQSRRGAGSLIPLQGVRRGRTGKLTTSPKGEVQVAPPAAMRAAASDLQSVFSLVDSLDEQSKIDQHRQRS